MIEELKKLSADATSSEGGLRFDIAFTQIVVSPRILRELITISLF